ncbi:hypothetical protein QBC36DRAFT_311962 [Triangularia setosa]|uniref:DUF7025 domain-containing protein n=1 Tax=Triangularia setosa TaxID=2587417 RepID=A0AAN6W7B1_9PEZI|nr:hypothetical protein QBC36DRAFT_311962 [Podospora setosa]
MPYSVEYLDCEGDRIATGPHPTTFDLAVARESALKQKGSAFNVQCCDGTQNLTLFGRIVELDEHYSIIGHHLEELERLRESCGAEQQMHSVNFSKKDVHGGQASDFDLKTSEHFGLLLDYIKTNVYKTRIETERQLHRKNLCTFQMLWLLFKPGTMVYVESGGNLSAQLVQSVVSDTAILSDSKQLSANTRSKYGP